ncbi:MAG: heat-inducible transcription repressor HrcA [Candidatus Aminicenantes bacterium RBG_16_63_16]|nr:MAG: heat-inducible transcription repressor HrcA [Candidatus Aminicenantes bacterium RBG_16_63_16]
MPKSVNFVLREKDKVVLNTIVEQYLKLGAPVSSGFVVHKRVVPDSPATIRNIMAKLEEMGYLAQPHASAGRVPTDLGLRFYVNSLLDETIFSSGPSVFEPPEFGLRKGDLGTFLNRVSHLLAERSDNLGFVISPRISRVHFNHVRLIKISEERLMIILMTTFNLVLTEIVDARHHFTQLELDRASQYLNQRFRGQNLSLVRDVLVQDLPRHRQSYENEMEKLTSMLRDYMLQEEREGQLFLQGTARLLDKPELFNMDKLKTLFQNFEEKIKLAKLISDFISLDRVKVLIGAETNLPDAADCALVLSHYGYNNQVLGTLGIIGPKRIPYRRIIPLVDQVAKRLSQTISEVL